MRRRLFQVLPFLAAALLAGCRRGAQSAVDYAGPQAARIGHLFWLMLIVCSVVFVAVIAFLIYAAARRPPIEEDFVEVPPEVKRSMAIWVGGAVAVTILVLFVFLVDAYVTQRGLGSLENGSRNALRIQLIAHQWWWEVHYEAHPEDLMVTTANEIHIPVGRPVMITLQSQDVIHSLWVPNLHGKKDLIPGRENIIWMQADRPGEYRGQCAEFCGAQHAHMALLMVAQPEDDFQQWLASQRLPAAEPETDGQKRGREVFLASPCILCHTIRGTQSLATMAPDLTHLASRRTIAAGTLPNTMGHLAGWIVDSQSIKPGNRMPSMNLPAENVQPLVEYLSSLK